MYNRKCLGCGELLSSGNKRAKYCGNSCRAASWRKRVGYMTGGEVLRKDGSVQNAYGSVQNATGILGIDVRTVNIPVQEIVPPVAAAIRKYRLYPVGYSKLGGVNYRCGACYLHCGVQSQMYYVMAGADGNVKVPLCKKCYREHKQD